MTSSDDPLAALVALRAKQSRTIIGLMSGTSADGVDAAVVRVEGHGTSCAVELVAFESLSLPPQVKQRIWGLPDQRSPDLCQLNFLLGETFADAALAVMRSASLEPEQIDLIGSHGQTARHEPPDPARGRRGATLQIGEGAVIAERTGLPVICDFRVADVAAGGHGAPLIPLVDYLLFSRPGRTIGLLNIGGIANITIVPPDIDGVLAFDTGPGNMALDAVARATSAGHETFDRGGARAGRGRIDEALLGELLAHPYFTLAPPKSTGRETFGRDFVYPLLDRFAERLDDLLATLTCLTAKSVAIAIERHVMAEHPRLDQLFVSGGGVHNSTLLRMLARHLAPLTVAPLGRLGMDPDAKEAVGFAVLANETLFCRPGNIPRATGAAGPRVLGKIALPSIAR